MDASIGAVLIVYFAFALVHLAGATQRMAGWMTFFGATILMTVSLFGRTYAAEPHLLIEQLKEDEAIAEADTLLLTVPNQLGVAYNVHVMEAILTTVAPGLGWR